MSRAGRAACATSPGTGCQVYEKHGPPIGIASCETSAFGQNAVAAPEGRLISVKSWRSSGNCKGRDAIVSADGSARGNSKTASCTAVAARRSSSSANLST